MTRLLRPTTMLISFFCLLLAQLCPPHYAAAAATVPRRPNIIFILTDDLDQVVTDPYLKSVMPFTSKLRDQGIRLANNFSAVICCEARAAILTGLHAHNNGVFTNGGDYGGYEAFKHPLGPYSKPLLDSNGRPIDNENRTFAKLLRDSGYRTSMIGKYMNGFESVNGNAPALPVGWTDFHVATSNSFYYGYGYELMEWREGDAAPRLVSYGRTALDYSTDVVAAKSVEFLKASFASSPQTPVMMYVAPTAPHLPLTPAPRHLLLAKQWKGTVPKNRPNYFSDGSTVEDKPTWLRATWSKRTTAPNLAWSEEEWSLRMGSLYAVDDLVKNIFDTLKLNGQLDNTLIVFTSDNGYNLGAHALLHKQAPYEESVRVPAFVWAGKNLGMRSATTESRMTMHTDYAPTFLELAGVPVPLNMDGKSLVPLLISSGSVPWRSDFIEEYYGSDAGGIKTEMPPGLQKVIAYALLPSFALDIPTHRMVRSAIPVIEKGVKKIKQYSYIEWYGDENYLPIHEYELYDVSQDPYQLDNLLYYNSSGCDALRKNFAARLANLTVCSGANCSAPPPYIAEGSLLDVSTCSKTGK